MSLLFSSFSFHSGNIGRLHRELVFDTRENAVRSKQNQWDLFNSFYGHRCSRDLRMTATINDFKQDIRDSYNRCGILFIISANEWKKVYKKKALIRGGFFFWFYQRNKKLAQNSVNIILN